MKKLFLIAAVMLTSVAAHAYETSLGADPASLADKEYKSGQKSTIAGLSDAILAAGEILSYDLTQPTNAYIVTRVGGAALPTGSTVIAGVATKAVATGDTGYFLLQTRGYATVKYDATVAITAGVPVCANSVGAAIRCSGIAASASKVIPLESKASGTGTDLKVLLNGS